jgi:hypothetical protein
MTNVSVEIEAEPYRRVEYFAAASGRTPSRLIADWTLERLATLQVPDPPKASREGTLDQREELRAKFRPEDVWVLMVGESAPAGGTFFYQADSNLFDATREAFERALGPMPHGEAFLERYREMGFWLYDVARSPVNRMRGRPRGNTVAEGVPALAALIKDLEPDFVVAVKTSLEGVVRQAARTADFPPQRLVVLPFPLYGWRREFVEGLAQFLQPGRTPRPIASVESGDGASETLTLHEAMERVLRTSRGGPLPARRLANEVATRGLYLRRDGVRADYQQLLARARKYPTKFDVSREGISLRVRGLEL